MTRVEVIVTVGDRTMRYEGDIEQVEIFESMMTGEIAIRPNPHVKPKARPSWGGDMPPAVWPWQKCLVGDNWTADDTP